MGEDQVDSVRRVSRRLRDLVEPLAANVYFAPEARAAYQHLGIEDYGAGYFTSRGACLGHVPGHVVAAAFGVFNPDVVVPAVAEGWSKTDVGSIFHEFADRVKKKGLILIISDLFDDLEHVKRGLKHLRHKSHEVIVFHILDHDELTFPFQRMTLFEGLEALPEVLANPGSLRQAYLEEINSYMTEVRKVCRDNRIDYVRLDTDDKLDVALSSFLAMRAGTLRK